MSPEPAAPEPAATEPAAPGAQPAAAPAGRAGRNLVAATAVGLGLGASVLVTIYTVTWLFCVLAGSAVAIGVVELCGALRSRGIRADRGLLVAATGAAAAAAYLRGPAGLLVAFAATVLVLLAARLRHGVDGYLRDVSAGILVAAYAPLLLGFAVLQVAAPDGPERIVAFIVLTICSDIGGYGAGVLFGRHPMAPAISPKKSWEGFAGSVALQAVAGVALFVYLLDAPWWQGLVAGVVLAVTATLGDFVESALKRDLGVKDLGTILPGHGGLMDRLDSLLPNAFVAWALFTAFLG